ncbi:PGF-pre-PGF domain-containing protein [Methanolobus chelungpuianus]|uniref:PGF-pre-PGF domain-containing protein n=1 Tax=Methanolobus chelungpuianus TaxID=502115 RepID=UPI002113C74B|nr:PGF-pre-PGF domain-containing protein [Methanolobus chelungpuianus]
MTGIKNDPLFGQIFGQITRKISLVFALALLTLTCLTFPLPAYAQTSATVYPSGQDVYANSTFSIYVDIEPATPFVGAQLDVQFDKGLITADKVEEGGLFGRDSIPHLLNKGSIDNSAGTVTGSYAVTLGGTSISSPGTFIRIDCTAGSKEGYCPLVLSNVILSDSQGRPIPVTVENGGVFIRSEAGNQEGTNESSPGGGNAPAGGGGAGGGSSATSEDAGNICLKEVKGIQVLSNTTVMYRFNEQGNPVEYISYHSLKNAGQITSTIEVLNNLSATVTHTPPGTVYRHVNIWVGKQGYATEENIQGTVIGFRVPKDWIMKNGFHAGSIRMYRFNEGNWYELQTGITGEDAAFVFFEADTPGFSPFAITAFAMATSSTQSNSNPLEGLVADVYGTAENDTQSEAAVSDQEVAGIQALGQNSAFFLIAALLFVTAIGGFLRKE